MPDYKKAYFELFKRVTDIIEELKKLQEDAEEIDASLSAINDGAKGVKNMILSDIGESSGDIEMGADNSSYLFVTGESWTSKLTISDIDYATIKEVGDNYFITIVFDDIEKNGDTSALQKAFDLRDKDEILASEEFETSKDYLTLNDYNVVYSGCKITATVNRLTDELVNLNYYKAAKVTADMTGAGTLEEYGDVSVMFTLEDKAYYEINWTNENPTSPLDTTTEAPVIEGTMTEATEQTTK